MPPPDLPPPDLPPPGPSPPHLPALGPAPPGPAASPASRPALPPAGRGPRRWLVAGPLALVAALLAVLLAMPRDHAAHTPHAHAPDANATDAHEALHGPPPAPADRPGTRQDPPVPDFAQLDDPGFRVIPLHEAARIAQGRFRGRLIGARLAPPGDAERARGVDLVHELRLLTPSREVLLIRLDARDGAFLEVRGAGLARARRPEPRAPRPASDPGAAHALPDRDGDPP